jgi:hypothetical protein
MLPDTRSPAAVDFAARVKAAGFDEREADRIAEEVDALWFGRRPR